MTDEPKSPRRIIVEVDEDTRYRLRLVAAKRKQTMKQLLSDLAKKAEEEAFPTPGEGTKGGRRYPLGASLTADSKAPYQAGGGGAPPSEASGGRRGEG